MLLSLSIQYAMKLAVTVSSALCTAGMMNTLKTNKHNKNESMNIMIMHAMFMSFFLIPIPLLSLFDLSMKEMFLKQPKKIEKIKEKKNTITGGTDGRTVIIIIIIIFLYHFLLLATNMLLFIQS